MQIKALRDLQVVVALEHVGRIGRDAHLLRLDRLGGDLPAELCQIRDAVLIRADLACGDGLFAVRARRGFIGVFQQHGEQYDHKENEQYDRCELSFGYLGSQDHHIISLLFSGGTTYGQAGGNMTRR